MLILAILAFLATLADTLFTSRRLEKYGPRIEANPLVRWLVVHLASPLEGCFVGVTVPSLMLIWGMVYFDLPLLLAGYTGMRLTLNWFQLSSMRLEPILDKELASARKDLPTPQGPSTGDPG